MKQSDRIPDVAELLRTATEEAMAGAWSALPAKVVSVDFVKQTISAQPMIKGKTTDKDGADADVSMPLLVDVPIVWPRGGGFACTVPLAAGDEVLIVFASRCIDSWWASGSEGPQMEGRMHDLSDGFAVLAPTSLPRALTDVQSDGIELRNDARDTYLRVTNGTIFIKGDIVHEGNHEQTGNMERTGTSETSGLITGAGGLTITGGTGVSMTGAIGITGAVTHTGSITSNGVNVGSTHVHGGVLAGGATSGGPQ